MSIVVGTEAIANPLQKSGLNKKSLCDYVVNLASGCIHGCSFCYVPSTPAIRTRAQQLINQGANDPQLDWGKYLFVREEIPSQLEEILSRKQTWESSDAGRGVVMLCSTTDGYQNSRVAAIARRTIEVLLKYNKRIRILTRGLLWVKDLDILTHPNVTVGMSLPTLNDELSRRMEPGAPPPSKRLECLKQGSLAGVRTFIAIAPTIPMMGVDEFEQHLSQLMQVNPEVCFWEPINARGTNGRRMLSAGLEFVADVMNRDAWAANFLKQWTAIETAAQRVGCSDRLHIWPDRELEAYVSSEQLERWWYRPTVEVWRG